MWHGCMWNVLGEIHGNHKEKEASYVTSTKGYRGAGRAPNLPGAPSPSDFHSLLFLAYRWHHLR